VKSPFSLVKSQSLDVESLKSSWIFSHPGLRPKGAFVLCGPGIPGIYGFLMVDFDDSMRQKNGTS